MASKLEIKNRIRSVDSTKKITKAMQLVAASKLKRCKSRMEKNREYAKYLKDSVDHILSTLENSNHPYLSENDATSTFTIVFTSDMGLCGGYNTNELKLLETSLNKEDPIVVFGSKGGNWLTRRNYHVLEVLYSVDEEDYEEVARIASKALEMYVQKEIGSIQVLYTRFINAVTFEPTIVQLLPVEKKVYNENEQDIIFEPKGEAILDTLIPMFLKSLLYSYWLETKASEQGSRQNAMENATDNAQELRDQLELQFNQARQAAITQEITEIVGGANALQ